MTLSDVAGDVVEDIRSLDSRMWRTLLALLFKPGFLSAEHFAGRKASYIPPFRLYLIVSFVMFMLLSLTANLDVSIDTGARIEPSSVSSVESDREIGLADENSPGWLKDLEQRLQENLRKAESDSSDFEDKLFQFLPQLVFVLVPLLALLVYLAYARQPFHYLQHLVFAIHCNCFIFTVASIGLILDATFEWDVEGIIIPLNTIYLPLALRRAYGSSWSGAILKSLFISLSNALIVIMGLAGLALFTLAML